MELLKSNTKQAKNVRINDEYYEFVWKSLFDGNWQKSTGNITTI